MRLVRRWVYRLGFRPKYPSIFYSPSLSWTYAANEAFKEVFKEWDK